MESQFGLVNMWAQGDAVTRLVALFLLGMSLASWIVIIVKALAITRYKKLARNTNAFWHSDDFISGVTALGPNTDNPLRMLALALVEGPRVLLNPSATSCQPSPAMMISCARGALVPAFTRCGQSFQR